MEPYYQEIFSQRKNFKKILAFVQGTLIIEVSLYVKGFGAAAVRESNHGCNEELC